MLRLVLIMILLFLLLRWAFSFNFAPCAAMSLCVAAAAAGAVVVQSGPPIKRERPAVHDPHEKNMPLEDVVCVENKFRKISTHDSSGFIRMHA